MSISRLVGLQSRMPAERNSVYRLAFSAMAAGTEGMPSTMRFSLGAMTSAVGLGAGVCAMRNVDARTKGRSRRVKRFFMRISVAQPARVRVVNQDGVLTCGNRV